MDKFTRSTNAPINITAIRTPDVVIGVFALGHYAITTDTLVAPSEPVLNEQLPVDVGAVLAEVVVGHRAEGKPAIPAAHLSHLVHFIAAITLALKLVLAINLLI